MIKKISIYQHAVAIGITYTPEQRDMFRDEVHLTVEGHRHMSFIYEHFLRSL